MLEHTPRILLVDDEQSIQTLLSFPLRKDGYEVVQATDGREALARFGESTFDLVVLDVMLPRVDGLEVCRRMRARSSVPIIMLTAKAEEIDRILGLELGADDYITKPFSPRELVLRVKSVMRRTGGQNEKADFIKIGDIVVDRLRFDVRVNDESLEMTPTEYKLLLILMERRGRVQS